MELLDRYLFAVGRYLPKARRDDILAELRANILGLADEREEELGRKLNLDEEEAILRQHGHPMLVAARYLPKQYLIGPTIFPFYWYVLKTAFPWVLLLYSIANALRFISEPFSAGRVVEIGLGFFPVFLYFVAATTVVFAAMDYATENFIGNKKVVYAWTPRKLPQVEAETEKRSNPVNDFLGSVVTLVFLVIVRENPIIVLGPGLYYPNMFRPAPMWTTVYAIAMVLVCIQLAVKGFVMVAPQVRAWRIAVDLFTKASAIVVIGYLIHARTYLVLGPNADVEKFGKLLRVLNDTMFFAWKVTIAILALQLLWEITKLVFPRWRMHLRPSHIVS